MMRFIIICLILLSLTCVGIAINIGANTIQSHPIDPKNDAVIMVAEARIECVKADLKLSEIELTNAESNYNRCCKLKNSITISDEHYGAAVQRLDNARVNVFRNKARLKESEGLLKIAKITGEVDKALTPR